MRRLLLASFALTLVAAGPRDRGRDQGPDPARDHGRDPAREHGRDQGRNAAPAQREQRQTTEDLQAAMADEQRLAAMRVAAAARLRDTEVQVDARAETVADLAARRDAAAARLAARAGAMAPLLPVMQRLALFPAETLLAIPGPPEQTVRGLAVLHGLARQLERESAELRQDQADLQAKSDAVVAALPELQAAQAEQAAQASGLDAQIAAAQARRQRAEAAGAEASRRVAAEAARAENLRTAMATLETARARAEAQAREDAGRAERRRQDSAAAEARQRQDALARPPGPGPDPHGPVQSRLVQPVAGRIMRGWGDATDAGPATGVSYRPAPGARVVAPCGGRVRFAGPFRSYGALLILDCGGGYAFVLAGLARLDAAVGGAVLAGEPVGVMPEWNAAGSGPAPALYLELRHDGQAVDPAPFLRRIG